MANKHKGQKEQRELALTIVIVIAFVVIFKLCMIYDPLALATNQGFTVESITLDRTVSNDAELAAANFIVTATLDGSNGGIVGYLTQDEFNNRLSGSGVDVSYPLQITVDSVNEHALYIIRNDLVPIEWFTYTTEWWCPSDSMRVPPVGAPLRPDYCVKTHSVGTKGSFTRIDTYFDVAVTAESHGETITGRLNTYPLSGEQQTAVDLKDSAGNFVGQAKWVGSLQTGVGIPDSGNYVVTTGAGTNSWRVRTKSTWDWYSLNFQSRANSLSDCAATALCTGEHIETLIGEANAYSSQILNDPSVNILDPLANQFVGGVNGEEYVSVNLRENNLIYSYPHVVFYIPAYWVGAYIPVGQPQIVDPGFVEVKSGQTGTLNVKIKNVGTTDASFDVTILQPCLIEQEGFARVTVPAGETRTASLNVNTGTASVDQWGSCSLKVYATNKPSNYAIGTFTYHAEQAVIPSPQPSPTPIPPVPQECVEECCAAKTCGMGVTFTSKLCIWECEVMCFFQSMMMWFLVAAVVILLLLLFILRCAPHLAIISKTRR